MAAAQGHSKLTTAPLSFLALMLQNPEINHDIWTQQASPRILFHVSRYWPAIAGTPLHTRELIFHLRAQNYDLGVIRHTADEPVSKEIAFAHNPTLTLSDGCTPIYQLGPPSPWRWGLQQLAQRYEQHRWARFWYGTLLRLSVQRPIARIAQPYEMIHAVYTGMTASVRAAQRVAHAQKKPFILTPLVYVNHLDQRAPRSLLSLYRRSDALIAMTQFEKDWLIRQGVQPQLIYVCPVGPLVRGPARPRQFRRRYHLGNHPVILFLAKQRPEKGYRALCQSAPLVWKRYPEARFVFVGTPTPESRLFFQTVQDPRILYLGDLPLADQASALAACDLFCLPSLHESSGAAYVEAWQYEKPVIAADLPVIRSLIDHEGDGLIVVPSPQAIAQAILRCLDHPKWRHQMGCQGYRKVRANYDWDYITTRMLDLYSTLQHHYATGRPLSRTRSC
ncbi:glycosyltransferase family 4 protein [Lyngbya confervoides]|uniref:Glycosyltransferase family 4 protein n=1 Tax=Lyngbya confervoides BDU141951 TaxID=1574623 RepID=A0ABD4SZ47_9CYAN|nr:glycosyltransferase family 4 protein [Lyngbya confervoides]MCM1981592.1 glycosyltransferase family 4 protein [Lyngbya confervoides BDU141951]